ncbi:MAG: hypothetical protein R6V49_05895, partial [Bacteroidales bacterium]
MPETGRILLFSPRGETPRLRFVAQTLFRDFAGLHIDITTSEELFLNSDDVRIVYGDQVIPGVPSVPAVNLLFETGIATGKPHFATRNGMPVLCPRESENAIVPFDIFAASFWFLSRYEE